MATPDDLLQDFAALRQRGIDLLQRLAGATWTDHNTHDPGITLLETLCYALTDLGYRTAFPVQDLLAGDEGQPEGGRAGIYTPARVLPCGPVTADDLRRLVIDLPGVKNAWIEVLDAPMARHDAAQGLVTVAGVPTAGTDTDADGSPPSPNVSDLRPLGLYRVRIEKSGLGEDVDGAALVRLAAGRLQQWRGLCEDVADIGVLDRQPVALDAAIEIAAGADATELLAAVYEAVAGYLSPALPLRSLDEMQARGWRVDQIFEGPLLARGFLDPVEWAAVERRSALRISDLIQALMAVPGVVAVKRLGFLNEGRVSSDWLLPIAADRSASFDLDGSTLRLERRGVRADHDALRLAARRHFEARIRLAGRGAGAGAAADEHDLPAPAGRPRQPGRYLSLMHHLPAAYGVGPAGLSSAEPVERRASAQQLKAYLMVFDQLLANQFAQLGQAGQLLSFDGAGARACFSQPVPDEGGALRLDTVRRQPLPAHQVLLASLTEDPWGDDSGGALGLARRHRMMDHLLARLGEHWADQPAAFGLDRAQDTPGGPADDDTGAGTRADGQDAAGVPLSAAARSLRDKQAFLQDYPALALRRGVGADCLADPAPDAAAPAGLLQRLALLLGLAGPTAGLHLVEHLLLRPLPGDAYQQGPWLRGVDAPDPFSLQLTLVLPALPDAADVAEQRQRLQQAVDDETPAHLSVRLLWLDQAAMVRFVAAQARWRSLWRVALRGRFGIATGDGAAAAAAAPGPDHQCALRSARNRVIDALGLGDSFPLTDLVVADGGRDGPIKVAHGRSARIAIDDAEAGVRYTLRGPDGRALKDAQGAELPPVWVDGTDGRVLIETPPVTDDIHYRIQATKRLQPAGLPPQPPVLLAQVATVRVGLDTRLVIELPDLPLLDATLASPQPGDPRLAPAGLRARVLVHQSQEGVDYALVVDGVVQADTVVGDLATITLLTPPLREDCQLAVQATKTFGGAAGGPAEQQLLDARLALAVLADPGLALQVLPGPELAYRDTGAVLRVNASQASAAYRVYARPVRDADWRRDAPADAPDLLRATDGRPAVPVPIRPDSGRLPDGFVAIGPALPGQGGDLDLPLGAPVADAVYLVQASKQHAAGDRLIGSEVGLQQAVLVLTQPDPAPTLQITLLQSGPEGTPLQLQVAGGQPGVFYAARVAPDGPALPLAAYVHQRDDQEAAFNKGLGQLAIGIDLVVAADAVTADPPASSEGPPARDQRPPVAPLLDLPTAPALPADTLLALRAVKAQTGVEVALPAGLRLRPLPEAGFDPPVLARGASAKLRVADSLVDEVYQLQRQGQALQPPLPGNGAELLLETGPVDGDALFDLLAAPGAPGEGLPLQQRLTRVLWVLPRADLALSARRSDLAPGEATEIVVAATELGVQYQLLTGAAGAEVPAGDALVGTGADLDLPTGPVLAATRFSVRATRGVHARATVLLSAALLLSPAAPA